MSQRTLLHVTYEDDIRSSECLSASANADKVLAIVEALAADQVLQEVVHVSAEARNILGRDERVRVLLDAVGALVEVESVAGDGGGGIGDGVAGGVVGARDGSCA